MAGGLDRGVCGWAGLVQGAGAQRRDSAEGRGQAWGAGVPVHGPCLPAEFSVSPKSRASGGFGAGSRRLAVTSGRGERAGSGSAGRPRSSEVRRAAAGTAGGKAGAGSAPSRTRPLPRKRRGRRAERSVLPGAGTARAVFSSFSPGLGRDQRASDKLPLVRPRGLQRSLR